MLAGAKLVKYLKRAVAVLAMLIAAPFVGAGLSDFLSQGALHDQRPLSFFDEPAPAAYTLREPDYSDLATASVPHEPAASLAGLPALPEQRPRDAHYIVISNEHNRLWLMRNDEIVRVAVCATGKGDTLHWEEGGKTWVFSTPTGTFTVQHKTTRPRWIPPEWHYVEQGEDPPDWLGRALEADYDMLGDAAINFGNDYNIHGTLFEGLLGRSITHGCVRIGARDLAYIYPRVGRGTKVFIY